MHFNEAEYLARLRNWVEHESPTFEAAAVNSMLDLAARDFAAAGASIERIAGRVDRAVKQAQRLRHRIKPALPCAERLLEFTTLTLAE